MRSLDACAGETVSPSGWGRPADWVSSSGPGDVAWAGVAVCIIWRSVCIWGVLGIWGGSVWSDGDGWCHLCVNSVRGRNGRINGSVWSGGDGRCDFGAYSVQGRNGGVRWSVWSDGDGVNFVIVRDSVGHSDVVDDGHCRYRLGHCDRDGSIIDGLSDRVVIYSLSECVAIYGLSGTIIGCDCHCLRDCTCTFVIWSDQACQACD